MYGDPKGVYQKQGGISQGSPHTWVHPSLKGTDQKHLEVLGYKLQQPSCCCASCVMLVVRMGTLKIG